MKFFPIILIISTVLLAGCINETQDLTEKACINSGGTISTQLCCLSSDDFPRIDTIGACGCSPENSHEVKICECTEGKIWNGETCAVIPAVDEGNNETTKTAEQVQCEVAGGYWVNFTNNCADICEFQNVDNANCTNMTFAGCDCGYGKCWNITQCSENLKDTKSKYDWRIWGQDV